MFSSVILALAVVSSLRPKYDRYALQNRGQAVSVRVKTDWGEEKALVRWREGKKPYEQVLRFPAHWKPRSRESIGGLPGVMLWQPRSGSAVLVVAALQDEYLIWEYTSPIMYQLSEHRWRRITRDPWRCAFSYSGSMYFRGPHLYVWDIYYDTRYAHTDAHKFDLHHFEWRKDRLRRIETRRTKRRHEWTDGEVGKKVPADDPLREFGMKWQWWK